MFGKKFTFEVSICIVLCVVSVKAESDGVYQDAELRSYLSQAVSDLETKAKHIQEQYVSVTSRLAKLEYDIPEKFQCLSNLFQFSNSKFCIDNNACLFYDSYELSDLERFFLFSEGDNYRDPDSPSTVATLEQLLVVSNQVVTLNASLTAINSNLNSLSNIVNSITISLASSQESLQSLTVAYNRLDEICDDLLSVVKINTDGSIVFCKSSPIIGRIEPIRNPYVYTLAQNWDSCCSKFRVSKDTFLESVTLYCDDPSKMPAPLHVNVSTVILDEITGQYNFHSWPCSSVDTSNFPRCVWRFSQNTKIPILSDRDYLVCITKSNGALYPYITSPYRQGSFYKPIGATEELPPDPPPNSPDPEEPELPRSNPSPQDWFNYRFACNWEESMYYAKELWSILKFTDDESFTFDEEGLALERGNITIGGSEVVTSSSLGDMFVSMLAEHPNALNSEITWNMFCNDLKDMLITTNGGTVIGPLKVSNLKINGSGDWVVGSTSNSCDIVIANSTGKVIAPNGDMTLLATEGGNIQAQSFLQLQNTTQCGIVEIPINSSTSAPVTCSGLTSNAIILLTPRQETTIPYWVEVDALAGTFSVKRSEDNNYLDNLCFNYLIIRK